jgi:nucleoside-diphosphate-sugar epimerase
MIKTVFITGATGFIGGTIAHKLMDAGMQVRGLARSQASAEELSRRGIEPIFGDLDDRDLLVREANNADAVINAANSDHGASVQALIEGLAGSGKSFLHTSGSSIVGDDIRGSACTNSIYDEYTPLVIQKLKQPRRDIDLMVLDAAKINIRSSVICPSLIYGIGKGLNQHSVQIPFLARNAIQAGKVQIVGAGLNVWSNVHINDVADLYLAALLKAPAGAFYFAENAEASYLAIAQALAKRLDLDEVESLDPDVAAQMWGKARAFYSFGSNSRVRSVRARQELDWAPVNTSVIDWILKEMPIILFTSKI